MLIPDSDGFLSFLYYPLLQVKIWFQNHRYKCKRAQKDKETTNKERLMTVPSTPARVNAMGHMHLSLDTNSPSVSCIVDNGSLQYRCKSDKPEDDATSQNHEASAGPITCAFTRSNLLANSTDGSNCSESSSVNEYSDEHHRELSHSVEGRMIEVGYQSHVDTGSRDTRLSRAYNGNNTTSSGSSNNNKTVDDSKQLIVNDKNSSITRSECDMNFFTYNNQNNFMRHQPQMYSTQNIPKHRELGDREEHVLNSMHPDTTTPRFSHTQAFPRYPFLPTPYYQHPYSTSLAQHEEVDVMNGVRDRSGLYDQSIDQLRQTQFTSNAKKLITPLVFEDLQDKKSAQNHCDHLGYLHHMRDMQQRVMTQSMFDHSTLSMGSVSDTALHQLHSDQTTVSSAHESTLDMADVKPDVTYDQRRSSPVMTYTPQTTAIGAVQNLASDDVSVVTN